MSDLNVLTIQQAALNAFIRHQTDKRSRVDTKCQHLAHSIQEMQVQGACPEATQSSEEAEAC
eukprot:1160573-Pelagomonas_calceolata.AAC.22